MSQRDNKLAVLRQLGQALEPTSLPDLLHKLGSKFKESFCLSLSFLKPAGYAKFETVASESMFFSV